MTEQKFYCKCGCGEEVQAEGKFKRGHYSKWKAQQAGNELQEESRQQPELPETPQETNPHLINVMSLQEYNYSDKDLMAWFIDNGVPVAKPIDYCGLVGDGLTGIHTASVLVLTDEGLFLPPFMIGGFLGLFPKSQEFSISDETDQSEESEIEALPENEGKKLLREVANELR